MATFGESKSILLLIFPSKRRAIIIVKDEKERREKEATSWFDEYKISMRFSIYMRCGDILE